MPVLNLGNLGHLGNFRSLFLLVRLGLNLGNLGNLGNGIGLEFTFLTKMYFYAREFFCKHFFTQIFFRPKIYFDCWPIFMTKSFLLKFFDQSFYLKENFFWPKHFFTKIFQTKFFIRSWAVISFMLPCQLIYDPCPCCMSLISAHPLIYSRLRQ